MTVLHYVRVFIGGLSSFLSIVGCVVILLTYFCYKDLKKPARRLLLYLSYADLFTALNYLANIVFCDGCQHHSCSKYMRISFAYLGIYFPVAAFLWTDAIALFVYLTATDPQSDVAETLASYCGCATYVKKHKVSESMFLGVFCWSLPALNLAVLVAMTVWQRQSVDHMVSGDGGGGWCWLQSFVFDMVGGKSVEITSYVFVITMYILTYTTLRKQRKLRESQSGADSIEQYAALRQKAATRRRLPGQPGIDGYEDKKYLTLGFGPAAAGGRPDANTKLKGVASDEEADGIRKDASSRSSRRLFSGKSAKEGSSGSRKLLGRKSAASAKREKEKEKKKRKPKNVAVLRYEWKMNSLLSRLLLIPAIFVFLRMWGTLRMFLGFYGGFKHSTSDEVLSVFQAFCDPAQGFFNAILFVAFVTPVRKRVKKTLRRHCPCECGYRCLIRSLLCVECLCCCLCWYSQYGTPFGPRYAFKRELFDRGHEYREQLRGRAALLRAEEHGEGVAVNGDSDEDDSGDFEHTPVGQHGNRYVDLDLDRERQVPLVVATNADILTQTPYLKSTATSSGSDEKEKGVIYGKTTPKRRLHLVAAIGCEEVAAAAETREDSKTGLLLGDAIGGTQRPAVAGYAPGGHPLARNVITAIVDYGTTDAETHEAVVGDAEYDSIYESPSGSDSQDSEFGEDSYDSTLLLTGSEGSSDYNGARAAQHSV